MGLYIKRMKKPSDCQCCVMYRNGYCGAKGGFCRRSKGVDDDCPLVEVKTPHGDLIDADKLRKEQNIWIGDGIAPTVIEAEVE